MTEAALIPITLLVCVTYAFTFAVKMLAEARMRSLFARSGVSDDLLRAMLAGEQLKSRMASLRWGLSLVALAAAFGIVHLAGWQELNAGAISVLAGAIGAAQLGYFAIAARRGRSD